MAKINDIRKLFDNGFNESEEWTDWYFSKVYNDDNALLSQSNSQPASCLMLEPYRLKLADRTVDMSYLSCATTARQLRGQGHMSRLINDALMEAASRGHALVALIPASTRLYFFYDRFDFSTIFYADEHRYTSLHNFICDDSYVEVEPLFEHFTALESSLRSVVLHSEQNFENVIMDNQLDRGAVISIADRATAAPAAMLFATIGEHAAVVREILTVSEAATDSILHLLRQRIGERMIIVRTAPSDNLLMLRSNGMGRIVSVEKLLEAIASQYPATDQVIRVRDRVLPDNNAIFIIHNGKVERVSSTMRRVTLDVGIDTLAKIIFNSKRIGETFSLPTFRPSMSLMLD
ncbi:MAG: GNAT family N-acetyltransferase [Muribaculaceae bacterium]|nr:GNAT family N-acetyltransferase [Muribaculaceae bacterium]